MSSSSMLAEQEERSLAERGKGVPFIRTRRITGYLTGGLDTWNNAKVAEEHDRVKHSVAL